MQRQRPFLLLILVIYIFSPAVFNWIVAPDGSWYRPFALWLLVIIIAYVIQSRGKAE